MSVQELTRPVWRDPDVPEPDGPRCQWGGGAFEGFGKDVWSAGIPTWRTGRAMEMRHV